MSRECSLAISFGRWSVRITLSPEHATEKYAVTLRHGVKTYDLT
ncbi:MAG: hypothetical protein PHN84_11155 [Desulfuromonadaceae bacterium]|nr:hypothetical protein [Desulfuromonadaceae bacterium]